MGRSSDAILAYGYDLGGGDEEWKIHQTDEYGSIRPDQFTWYDEDDEDGSVEFIEQAENRLLVASGFTETDWEVDGYFARKREAKERLGVKFRTYCSGEDSMYVLAAKVITVSWGDSELLDLPALMSEPAENGWDEKLRAAIEVLGITPKQEQPGWVLCSYWG